MRPLVNKVLIFLLGLYSSFSYSATFTADGMVAGGVFAWNDGTTWGNASPGVVGVDFPGPGDIVNIPGGETVEIPAGYAASCASITINSNQVQADAFLTLIDATSSLNVSGNFTMNPHGCFVCGGVARYGTVNLNGGAITIGGDLTATSVGTFGGLVSYSQSIITGSGTITVAGNVTLNNINPGNPGAILNMNTAGSVLNVGGTFTIGVVDNGTGANGSINYTGGAGQTILSAISYYNLGISGGGLKTLNGNTLVKNTLTLTSGNINAAGNTLTLGTSGAALGALSHTSGWLYNGSFKRWYNNGAAAVGDINGLFPVGSSFHYRPFWISSGLMIGIPSAGTIAVTHTGDYSHPAFVTASHTDASWGNTLQGVSKSTWAVVAADGFSHTNLSIRFGGLGFGTNVTTDLDASLLASVVATHAATTGTGTEPYVNRTGLTSANLNNTFRIGTRNVIQSPLPITLVSFDANIIDQEVRLDWVTSTEVNNDYFIIQRSRDAMNWENLKQIDGAGNSSYIINYFDIDSLPYPGTSFYRLEQTDFNGTKSYSHIESVNFSGLEIIKAYPMPASSEIDFLINTSLDTHVCIEIYNSVGQLIVKRNEFFQKGVSTVGVDITAFASGNYMIKVQSENFSFLDKHLFIVSK